MARNRWIVPLISSPFLVEPLQSLPEGSPVSLDLWPVRRWERQLRWRSKSVFKWIKSFWCGAFFTVSTPAIMMSRTIIMATFRSIFNSFSRTLSSAPGGFGFLSNSSKALSMCSVIMLAKEGQWMEFIRSNNGAFDWLCDPVKSPHELLVIGCLHVFPDRGQHLHFEEEIEENVEILKGV